MTTEIQFEYIDDAAPGLYEGPTLYKLDSTGRLRTWKMQLTGEGHYRTLSGLADGKQAESGWTIPVPASKDTVKDQGEFEVRAKYQHQLDREYHDNPDTVSQPKMIEPMLAKTYSSVPVGSYFQPKLDGIRCIMTAEGMFTRQGQQITAVPHLHAAAAPLFAAEPDLVLDGELYNHDLREDFGAISSVVRKKNPTAEQLAFAADVMQYHIYDIVDPTQPFSVRSKRLADLLNEENTATSWLVKVATLRLDYEGDADTFYGEAVAAGYEGGIYRLDKPYELGRRSKFLLKRKDFMTEEFPVLRVEEGAGNWSGAVKRFVLENPETGKEFGAGVRGSYIDMKALLDSGKTPAEVTLRFFGRSPDGVPRFPVVIDIHMDGRTD